MAAEEESKRSFKVQDRRRFSESGDVRADAGDEREHKSEPAPPRPEDIPGAAAPAGEVRAEGEKGRELPEINFATFVISLSTQALVHLGEIPDPADGGKRTDLDAAKQTIDILGMLETKTRGNLEEGEVELLRNALYDLRMRYVEQRRRS